MKIKLVEIRLRLSNLILLNEHKVWKDSGFFDNNIKYSDKYCSAFFYRDIKVEPVTSSNDSFESNLLKKVTVTIKWSEGRMPSNIHVDSERNRQIQLSVLVINDDNLLF